MGACRALGRLITEENRASHQMRSLRRFFQFRPEITWAYSRQFFQKFHHKKKEALNPMSLVRDLAEDGIEKWKAADEQLDDWPNRLVNRYRMFRKLSANHRPFVPITLRHPATAHAIPNSATVLRLLRARLSRR